MLSVKKARLLPISGQRRLTKMLSSGGKHICAILLCRLGLRATVKGHAGASRTSNQEISTRSLTAPVATFTAITHFLRARRFSNKRLAEVTNGAIASSWRPGVADADRLTLAGWRDSAATQDPDSASTHCRQHEGIKKRPSFMRMIVFRLPVFLG